MDTASLPIIRQELEHLYSLATQEGLTPFTSLRPMYNYIAYTQSNELLRKIALTMHDFREGTDYIKLDRSNFDYRHDAEIINMASEHFQSEVPPPLDEYFKLLDMYEEYDKVKDIQDEKEFKKAEIIVPVKTVIGLSPRKTSGRKTVTVKTVTATIYLYNVCCNILRNT